MKIFDKGNLNFVDKNNVFVGYDMFQSCCEYEDWFISTKEENEVYNEHCERMKKTVPNRIDYVFDTSYFYEEEGFDRDAGTLIRFKLVAENKPILYLHIFNSHNGYYGHGFEAKIGDEIWKKGYL